MIFSWHAPPLVFSLGQYLTNKMKFKEIASVAGKGGLFKILKPARVGVVLESLDAKKSRIIAGVDARVSVFSEISIYCHNEEGATPLEEVMRKIHKEFNGDTGLDKNAAADELKSFMEYILPDYDQNKVYLSDIKKLVTWYNLLVRNYPEVFETEPEIGG